MTDAIQQGTNGRAALIKMENLGKLYVKYEDTPILLSSVLRMRSKTRRSRLWAVRGIDLEVASGETIGVIGRNGSGKSTLLRMLAGVAAPSEGVLEVRGRVAPLISVGVGFHPELTGRENVYVNGTILGLTRKEIDERFDEIVAFAEIAEFIDTPVKFYSSGMFVRLGFAVAVAAEPDVLLVDEVLAVGDIGFQVKCFVRMRELQEAGSTIVVVSHNLGAVRNLCARVLVLHDGTPRFLGDTDEGISIFHELVAKSRGSEELQGAAPIEFQEFTLIGRDGEPTSHVESNDEMTFTVRTRLNVPVHDIAFSLTVSTEAGMPIYGDTDWQHVGGAANYQEGDEVVCRIRLPANLTTGSYTAVAGVNWNRDPQNQLSTKPVVFYVSGRNMARGIVDLGASFEVDRQASTEPGVAEG